jgi:hypothetical protein
MLIRYTRLHFRDSKYSCTRLNGNVQNGLKTTKSSEYEFLKWAETNKNRELLIIFCNELGVRQRSYHALHTYYS